MRELKGKFVCRLLTAFVVSIAAGCNATQPTINEPPVEASKVESQSLKDMEYLAAIDLINTLVQVPRLHPANAEVLHMRRPAPGFGQNVYEVMSVAGYEIQLVDTGVVREPQVSYSRRPGTNKTTFQINIENFKARRAYSVVDNKVRPDSSIYIFGADPDAIDSNDQIFENYQAVLRSLGREGVTSQRL